MKLVNCYCIKVGGARYVLAKRQNLSSSALSGTFSQREKQGLAAIKWIFLIPIPLQGGVDDVFAGAGQFMLVPDNPFVILTLPNRTAGGVADDVDLFG
jgi:hypothetical protein